jgi:hypothetical protein
MGAQAALRHVFLSYAKVDSAAADVVQAVLEQADVPVWPDTAQDLAGRGLAGEDPAGDNR